jgi:hypothetical protein
MKCISYDADFQRNLAEKFPTFKPKPKDGRKSKKSSGTKGSPATKQPKLDAGRKRKRLLPDTDDDVDEPVSEDSDDDLDAEMPTHQVYGTRSRPFLLV